MEGAPSEGEETEFEVSDSLAKELSRFIFKVHIPNDDRGGCLDMLRKMNIHNGSLFPDAQGASLYCNDWLERLIDEEAEERAHQEGSSRTGSRPEQIRADGGGRGPFGRSTMAESQGEQAVPTDLTTLRKGSTKIPIGSSFDWPHRKARLQGPDQLRRVLCSLDFPSHLIEVAVENS